MVTADLYLTAEAVKQILVSTIFYFSDFSVCNIVVSKALEESDCKRESWFIQEHSSLPFGIS